jgi:zinc transport system ATP-binding protein
MDAGRRDIEATDVCFFYGEREALHNVSFSVPHRAFVAVVGPNGGGKTTLMRLLLGDLSPAYGAIRVLGQDPADASPRIGYVPQLVEFDAAFPATVLDVVLTGASARRRWGGFTRAERDAAVAVLGKVGLPGLARRPFADLSGGQRQRVLIAQALVSAPEMLFLDEPTANVDVETEAGIYELLAELNRRLTVVVVSHNLSVVTAHATHVLCVNHTATLHRTEDLADGWVDAPFGAHFTMIHHHADCEISQAASALSAPHHGLHAHASETGGTPAP